jgi:hypothetical protein
MPPQPLALVRDMESSDVRARVRHRLSGVALLEVALGGGPKIGAVTVLQIQLVQNLIHWAVALAVF